MHTSKPALVVKDGSHINNRTGKVQVQVGVYGHSVIDERGLQFTSLASAKVTLLSKNMHKENFTIPNNPY